MFAGNGGGRITAQIVRRDSKETDNYRASNFGPKSCCNCHFGFPMLSESSDILLTLWMTTLVDEGTVH